MARIAQIRGCVNCAMFVGTFAVSSWAYSTPAEDTAAKAAPLDIKELIDCHEKTRAAADSVQYDYEITQERYLSQKGKLISQGSGQCAAQGPLRRSAFALMVTTDDGVAHTSEVASVLNDDYFACKRHPNSPAKIFHHLSMESYSQEELINRQASLGFDAMLYGFGTGDQSLQNALGAGGIDNQSWWESEPSDKTGDPNIQRFVFYSPRVAVDGSPTLIVDVDRKRGCLVSRVVAYSRDGTIGLERTIDLQLVNGEFWFPKRIDEVMYASWLGDESDVAALKGEIKRDEMGRLLVRTRGISVTNVRTSQHTETTFTWPLDGDPSEVVHISPAGDVFKPTKE